MNDDSLEVLREFEALIKVDLIRFKLSDADKPRRKRSRVQSEEFIRYLVSVATHPIGLRASVSPFNSSSEHMLAYIMGMCSLNSDRLEKIISSRNKDLIGHVLKDDERHSYRQISAKKRHSWRPELRIRLGAPTFLQKQNLFMSNLFVRVYLFRKKEYHNYDQISKKLAEADKSTGHSSVLNRIFKKLNLESSILIRPVDEMKCLINFHSMNITKMNRYRYKMVHTSPNTQRVKDDVHLPIRRYYCQPETAYMIRFEFWLDIAATKTGVISIYKRFVKHLFHSGCIPCRSQSSRGSPSTHMNESQEFYGYININLCQLPSYAIKQSYAILTLKGRKVNNCEILIEPRNRRIVEVDRPQSVMVQGEGNKPRKPSKEYLINHMRLYMNCVLYQSLELIASFKDVSDRLRTIENVTLDNLLYLPAYSLINQHRLQSNLNQFEDQCLRRVSLLLLVMKLDQVSTSSEQQLVLDLQTLLISVTQNEYLVTNRSVDEKTRQELDPFEDSLTETDGVRQTIVALELETLKDYTQLFLSKRLKQWLVGSEKNDDESYTCRSIALASLKLLRMALTHIERPSKINSISILEQRDVISLRSIVERLLCRIIIDHVRENIEKILQQDTLSPTTVEGRKKIRNVKKQPSGKNKIRDLWVKTLYEIRCIDHDIRLHWSRRGLDSLITNEREFVRQLKMFASLDKQKLDKTIESKIDYYLRV